MFACIAGRGGKFANNVILVLASSTACGGDLCWWLRSTLATKPASSPLYALLSCVASCHGVSSPCAASTCRWIESSQLHGPLCKPTGLSVERADFEVRFPKSQTVSLNMVCCKGCAANAAFRDPWPLSARTATETSNSAAPVLRFDVCESYSISGHSLSHLPLRSVACIGRSLCMDTRRAAIWSCRQSGNQAF